MRAEIPYGLTTQGGVTLHTLRHTFATRLADRGIHEFVIMQLMGHSTIRQSRVYTHATPEAMLDAVERLSAGGEVLEFRSRRA